jgi:hypothetical protein
MWPLSSSEPIAEYEASDEIDEIYHDIRQTLRVTGINLIFRVLATFPHAQTTIWQMLSPVVSMRVLKKHRTPYGRRPSPPRSFSAWGMV